MHDALTDNKAKAIVESIIALAHALGLRVVAEAVETSEQLDLLRSLGCDAMQGYYFRRPLPPDSVEQLIKDGSGLETLPSRSSIERYQNGTSRYLKVDGSSREVRLNGNLLSPSLSRRDFDVLLLLFENRGAACSKDEIAQRGWADRLTGDVADQDIQSCIHRIRAAIEPDPANPKYLLTVRQYGYRLDPQ